MPTMKLAALDEDDLAVISAHVQDSILKVGDIEFQPKSRRLVLKLRRFCWEAAAKGDCERHLACLHFSRVEKVRSCHLKRDDPEGVLSLLAVQFLPGEVAPAGTVSLVFSGGAEIRAEVECLEVGLADLGAAFAGVRRPEHALD